MSEIHFSRIKNIQLKHLFHDFNTLSYGWDIMLLASETITTLDLPMAEVGGEVEGRFHLSHVQLRRIHDNNVAPENVLLTSIGIFNLGLFPALRHFKIQWRSSSWDNLSRLPFLTQLLSSSIGLKTLEIELTWHHVLGGHGKDLFLSDARWSALDQLLTSQTFVSLSKFILRLRLEMELSSARLFWGSQIDYHHDLEERQILELERNLTLPHVNDLFPLFRALTDTRRILETHLEVVGM